MLDKLKSEFMNPDDEFSPIPFWFWNGDLKEEEIKRQIHDFKSKGIMGFVLHPRIGIPREIEYLSERFMELVKFAVEEASTLNMKVILYDEGMYPSGSAHGLVIKDNPEYASKALKMLQYPCDGVFSITIKISEGDKFVSALVVKKSSDNRIISNNTMKLDIKDDKLEFTAPDNGIWSVLIFVETFSKGTIRGVHFGEDDNEQDAPPSGDLLNKDAMEKFIMLTHECYYSHLKEYFGNTVIAMFTDEPGVLGRCSLSGIIPWTGGFLEWYLQHGNSELDLPLLWLDGENDSEEKRRNYRKAVSSRLAETYYKPIALWCESHGIALTGHPEHSGDIGVLKHFHIPGQDIVWRYIAPKNDNSIVGEHSTLGKCSSDAARHYGRRRNANECFGCCGLNKNHWAFTAADMKWYLDWLFVRGVNLIIPHAFYYSIEGPKRIGERPPDVGPNNIWWKYYKTISKYIKRICWLLTDNTNVVNIAVLCEEDRLPWAIVKPMYQNQIGFNYLEYDLLCSNVCKIEHGLITIANQNYSVVVVEDTALLTGKTVEKLQEFSGQGGTVIVCDKDGNSHRINNAKLIKEYSEVVEMVYTICGSDIDIVPSCKDLRVNHFVKSNLHFYFLVNEGESKVEGALTLYTYGRLELWDAWNGTIRTPGVEVSKGKMIVDIKLEPRQSIILCVDSLGKPIHVGKNIKPCVFTTVDIVGEWTISGLPENNTINTGILDSWTKLDGMKHYSGTLVYEISFEIGSIEKAEGVELNLGEVVEIAHLYINGLDAGFKMWHPYSFNIKELVKVGVNTLKVEVTNSLANRIECLEIDSGLLGPVKILLKQ